MIFQTKMLTYYKPLTRDIKIDLDLTQEEAAVVLQAYDYGVYDLPQESIQILDRIIAKLKQQIWP